MIIKKLNKFTILNYILFCLLFSSIYLGYYLNEDALGGAKHDYLYHLNFLNENDNLGNLLNEFSTSVRNSPFFYIIIFYLNKFLDLETIRFLNSFTSIIIVLIFYKTLKIKFNTINHQFLFILSLILFLSPTIRSLSIWPYPLQYGIIFFLLSINFYLKYEFFKDENNIKYPTLTFFYLSIAAYFYPTFAAFIIYFFFKFFFYTNNKNRVIYTLINLILCAPALIYIYKYGFFLFNVSGLDQNSSILESFNYSNKIILISTISSFLFLPFILDRKTFKKFSQTKKVNIIYLIIISILISIFFNYDSGISGGGGFFYKLSNIIFKNNLLLFFIFFLTLAFFSVFFKFSLNNILLVLSLATYNIQYTIYNKYYDPVIIFILLFLLENKDDEKSFINKFKLVNIYIYFIIYYILSIFKSNIH